MPGRAPPPEAAVVGCGPAAEAAVSVRRTGARYRLTPEGIEVKLASRVPCENEMWFAETTKPVGSVPTGASFVVSGASLDSGRWEKL